MQALLTELQRRFTGIALPMAPGFYDVTMAASLGITVEWRHTHEISLTTDWRSRYTAKVRNHLAAARKAVTVTVSTAADDFDFTRGLVNQSQQEVSGRSHFLRALRQHNVPAFCLSAVSEGAVVGQAVCVCHANTAYLFHSWFERRGPRGIPTLLIDSAASVAATSAGCRKLDLEGSVLETVDVFMSGFGGDIAPYPYLHWSRGRQ